MAPFQKLSIAILVLVVATSFSVSAAQKTSVDEGCVMSSAECTCAQSPAAGECTRPTEKDNCLQGDCVPSHKCDCFGYELCAISTCGKWSPAVNAILSRTAEFQCKYDVAGSKCRTATVVMDTLDAADNSKAASTKYVDDIVVDELEMAADLKEALPFKVQTLDAFRITLRVDEVSVDELNAVSTHSGMVLSETKLMVKDISEASEDASEAYEAMENARIYRTEAREHEAAAEAEELAEEEASNKAKDKNTKCDICAEMQERIVQLRKARRKAAKESGSWAKKGRNARERVNLKKLAVSKRKNKVQASSAKVIAMAQRILNRLGGMVQ